MTDEMTIRAALTRVALAARAAESFLDESYTAAREAAVAMLTNAKPAIAMTHEEREHRIRDILQRVSFQAGGAHPPCFETAVTELVAIADAAPSDGQASALDSVYTERTRLVALVAALCRSMGFAAGLGEHDPADAAWDPLWRTIVFVEIPDGTGGSFQASWHVALRDRGPVDHLPPYGRAWDGHTTWEKYKNIDEVARWDQIDTTNARAMHLALRNCLALARAKIYRDDRPGGWEDIVRFCAAAGVHPSPILRSDAEQPAAAPAAPDQEVLELLADMITWAREEDGVPDACVGFWEVMMSMGASAKPAGIRGYVIPLSVQAILDQRRAALAAKKAYEAPAVVATTPAHQPRFQAGAGHLFGTLIGCSCGWAPLDLDDNAEALFSLHVANSSSP